MTLREQLQDFVVAEIGSLGGRPKRVVAFVYSSGCQMHDKRNYGGGYDSKEKPKQLGGHSDLLQHSSEI